MKMKLGMSLVLLGCGLFFKPVLGICGDTPSHKAAGDSYLREGRFSSSIAEYQKALLGNPDSTVATAVYFNLAIAYYSERNIQGAVNALEKLVVLKPQDVEAQYNLGCLKLYRRDLKESTACFNKASCCCNPDSPFFSPVHQGLALAQVLQTADPNTQNLIFLLLEKGMLSRNP